MGSTQSTWDTWLPTQAVTMKSFVLSSLFACGLAAPTTHVNSGVPVGPLTPAFGDAVQTPKGLRSLALEGFSEDLNQDGFVDPFGQAVVAAPVAYTVPHLVSAANVGVAPVAAVRTAVAPVAYNIPSVYATAPVAVKAAEPVEVKTAPVTYTVPQVYTHAVPRSTLTPSPLLVFLPPPSCSPRPLWLPLPSSTWPPPTLTSPPSSAASQLQPLPLLLPPLLRKPLESRWLKRESRPVEVQKQRDAS